MTAHQEGERDRRRQVCQVCGFDVERGTENEFSLCLKCGGPA